jgi:hypothetical protein
MGSSLFSNNFLVQHLPKSASLRGLPVLKLAGSMAWVVAAITELRCLMPYGLPFGERISKEGPFLRGTEGSHPAPSSGESATNRAVAGEFFVDADFLSTFVAPPLLLVDLVRAPRDRRDRPAALTGSNGAGCRVAVRNAVTRTCNVLTAEHLTRPDRIASYTDLRKFPELSVLLLSLTLPPYAKRQVLAV